MYARTVGVDTQFLHVEEEAKPPPPLHQKKALALKFRENN